MSIRPIQTSRTVRFTHLNVQKSAETQHIILNKHVHDIDVFIAFEPAWAGLGNDDTGRRTYGSVQNSSWFAVLPVPARYEDDPRPRVILYYKRSTYTFTIVLRPDLFAHPDILIFDLLQDGQAATTFMAIYNDPKVANTRSSILKHLPSIRLPAGRPVVLTGDFNISHPLWNLDDRSPSHETANFVEWLDAQGYSIHNEKAVPTWHRPGRRTERSVIDLTFSNTAAMQGDVVKEWCLDATLPYASDHVAVRWTVDPELTEVTNIAGLGYNLKEVTREEWVEAHALLVEAAHENLAPLLKHVQVLSHGEIERLACSLSDTFSAAIALTGKERRPSASAKPFWCKDLSTAADTIAEAKATEQSFVRTAGFKNRALAARVQKAKNFFKKLLKRKRADWANEILAKAEGADIFRFREWSKGERTYPSPAIYRGPDQAAATSHEEKCDALRDELYQPPPPLPVSFNADLESDAPADIPFSDVTRSEVHDAIFSSDSKSAPGSTQVTYRELKWAWEYTGDYITGLAYHCVKAGYHPKIFRRAIAIALRKLGKPDYSKPRTYRLITLLEALGKVIEKVVARRLTFLAGAHGLVPAEQFGGCANASTVDAMLVFVNDVHAAWNHKQVTSALTFDIKGYFDFVNHARLLHVLRSKGIPLPIVRWVSSFLSEREAAVCLDGKRGAMKPVLNGIPQGSPVSPILAAFYSAELIEKMQEPLAERAQHAGDQPTRVSILCYVDDGMLYVSSHSLETNTQLLEAAYVRADQWLRSAGLAPDMDKRELMHYTRAASPALPPIVLRERAGNLTTIHPRETVRWLGVHFDRKLSFNHHVGVLAGRAATAAGRLSMLANTVRGLTQINVRKLFNSCVKPILTYAAPVWWPSRKQGNRLIGKKTHLHKLEAVKHRALRTILGVFRTTPIEAMHIEASIPPLKHALDYVVRQAGLRFNKLDTRSPVLDRLSNEWRHGATPTTPPPLRAYRLRTQTTPLLEVASHTSAGAERIRPFGAAPWRRTHHEFGPRFSIRPKTTGLTKDEAAKAHRHNLANLTNAETVVCYADGSMLDRDGYMRVGAGYIMYHAGRTVRELSVGLGGKAEVYDAELTGLRMALLAATEFA